MRILFCLTALTGLCKAQNVIPLPSPGAPTPTTNVSSPTPSATPSETPAPTGTLAPTVRNRCPDITEPCMDEDNFAECQALVEAGCEQLLVLESCPLQFDCADPLAELCSQNAGCAARNLTGLCCPSREGDVLDCCAEEEVGSTPAPTASQSPTASAAPSTPTTTDETPTVTQSPTATGEPTTPSATEAPAENTTGTAPPSSVPSDFSTEFPNATDTPDFENATEFPTSLPSEMPSSLPLTTDETPNVTASPSTSASSSPGPAGSGAPASTPVPSMMPVEDNVTSAAQCSANSACAALNLTGDCCPTVQNWTLACCGGEVEETCAENPECAELNVTGACCPTPDGKWLDCCEYVPNQCLLQDGICVPYSTRQHLQDIAAASGTSDGVMMLQHSSIVSLIMISLFAMVVVY